MLLISLWSRTNSEACHAYQKILEMVPTLDDVVSAMSDDNPEELELLISYVSDDMRI